MDWCKCLQWNYFINTNVEQVVFNMTDNFTGISRPKKNPKQTIKLWSESKNRDRKVSASVTIFRATPFPGLRFDSRTRKVASRNKNSDLRGLKQQKWDQVSKKRITMNNLKKNSRINDITDRKKIELERVPDPVRRPGAIEKLAINKPNTRY